MVHEDAADAHEAARILISKAWDGELTDDEERRLAGHLADCARCNEAARRFRTLLDLLDRAYERQPRPEANPE